MTGSDVERYCPVCGFKVDSESILVAHLDVAHGSSKGNMWAGEPAHDQTHEATVGLADRLRRIPRDERRKWVALLALVLVGSVMGWNVVTDTDETTLAADSPIAGDQTTTTRYEPPPTTPHPVRSPALDWLGSSDGRRFLRFFELWEAAGADIQATPTAARCQVWLDQLLAEFGVDPSDGAISDAVSGAPEPIHGPVMDLATGAIGGLLSCTLDDEETAVKWILQAAQAARELNGLLEALLPG